MDADSPETQPSSGAVFSERKPEQQNNSTEKHTKGRKGFRSLRKAVKHHFQSLKTKVCRGVPEGEPSQENPQTSRAEPTADSDPLEAQQVFDYAQATQSRAAASAESSSDVFEDAFEYFPAENSRAQPSSENNPEQQNNPTEKHTKGRKGFRSLRKAVKHHFQSLKTKVCRGVSEGEPSQENPQTSRAEPTADTDPLEAQQVFDYAQATQSRAVASAESSSDVFEDAFEYFPAENSRAQLSSENNPEQQNNPTEKHTKGRKGFRSLRKAVKHHFQSLKTKVCRGVSEGEPSQENPQTSRAEPTADTDPLEAQQVFDYAQATQSRAAASAESSSDVFEDAFEYFPAENSRAQPSSQNNPEQQNNPTEKHTKGRKGFRSLRKAVKHHFQSLKTKVCRGVSEGEPSQENPQTSRAEPTADTDPLDYPLCPYAVRCHRVRRELVSRYFYSPYAVRLQHGAEYIRSLYEVGEKLRLGGHLVLFVHEGIRRSDGQQVLIKFVKRLFIAEMALISDELFKPWYHEAIIMLALQRPSSCEHVIRLYDWFIMEELDILVMENPRPCVTLSEFIRQNRRHLNEETARRILQQLTVALKHCLDRGVDPVTDLRKIVINTDTLQLKIIDFSHTDFFQNAQYDSSCRARLVIAAAEGLYKVLEELIDGFPLWKKAFLSRDCRDLLWKLGYGGPAMIETLQDILDHAWFRDLSTANEGEGN